MHIPNSIMNESVHVSVGGQAESMNWPLPGKT